jgi:hypothetical protein
MVSSAPDLDKWVDFVQRAIQRRPHMSVQDVYKLIYQGVLGPEHLIDSPDLFEKALREELAGLNSCDDDPLWEAARPDGSLARVYLWQFMEANGEVEWLVGACLETGKRSWGTVEQLRQVWKKIVESGSQGHFSRFERGDLAAFDELVGAGDFPVLHHSIEYQKLYKPAYRLVAFDLLKRK